MAEAVIGIHSVEDWKIHFERAVESKKLVVVDFTATWCPPCRMIAPIFADLAKKLPHVIFFKVDVDEVQALSEEFNVEAMPTFVFLKEGNEVDRLVGTVKEELLEKITKHGTVVA